MNNNPINQPTKTTASLTQKTSPALSGSTSADTQKFTRFAPSSRPTLRPIWTACAAARLLPLRSQVRAKSDALRDLKVKWKLSCLSRHDHNHKHYFTIQQVKETSL